MKVLSSALLFAAIINDAVQQHNGSVDAALWGWGSGISDDQNETATATVVVSGMAAVPTPVSSRTVKQIINEDRRFVVFNSRRLTGECLPICNDKTPSPTGSPTYIEFAETMEPTDSPTGAPTNKPTENPTGQPTAKPTNDPTATPTNNPTAKPTDTPTANPTSNPTNIPTARPTATPTNNPTGKPTNPPVESPTNNDLDCEALVNLGYDFSKATGPNAYPDDKCYPHVRGADFRESAGKDDSVAVFVGGSYNGVTAAEVEGRMVVLGDLSVKSNGPGNFVSVGVGTHVLPNSGIDCITVGGNINAQRDIQVFNQRAWMGCGIVYKGSATNLNRWKNEHGTKRNDPNLDMSHYEAMRDVFQKKSQYWKTLPTTPNTRVFDEYGGTNFKCTGNGDEIQVFNIQQNQRSLFTGSTWGYEFSNSCSGKTILINFQGTGDIKMNAVDLIWNGKRGYGSNGFPTCMTSSILWNFPDARSVEIGNGKSSEFQGSLLVTGNMKMTTTGHSGRTIVLGNLEHNKGGSEFHNYEYDPPIPLPEPDCDDYLASGIGGGGSSLEQQPTANSAAAPTSKPVSSPTANPTSKPTPAPTAKATSSGGGNSWDSGTCGAEWDRCDGPNGELTACCDGLYCDDMGWGAQCKKKPNAQCLVKGLACHNSQKSCCNGLKCVGNEWHAECKL